MKNQGEKKGEPGREERKVQKQGMKEEKCTFCSLKTLFSGTSQMDMENTE